MNHAEGSAELHQIMKNKMLSWVTKPLALAALMSAVALTYGCAVYTEPAGTEVEVDTDQPAPIVETVPANPGPGYVWIGGAWDYRGHNWVWEHGHYDRPPRAGAVWVPHSYSVRNGKRVFVHGGWR